MRKSLTALGLLVALGGAVVATSGVATAQDMARPASEPDPLDALKEPLKELDGLLEQGRTEDAVAKARERAKDGTAEGHYLLGHTLGAAAVARVERQFKEKLAARKSGDDRPPPDATFDPEATALLDESRESFERSNEAGGLLFAPAHFGLAHVAFCKHDVNGGIAALRKAVAISKNFKAAALELARALWEKGLDSEASFVLYQFLAERPKDVNARIVLGMFKMKRERFEEAEPEFRTALSHDPESVVARKQLAGCLMSQGKHKEAAEQFEIVRRADRKDGEPYIFLFHEYVRLRKRDEAVAVLNDLVNELPGTEEARRASSLLAQLKEDPSAWEIPEEVTMKTLVRDLGSPDPAFVQATLEKMRQYQFRWLPQPVYRFVSPVNTTPAQRRAAVRLIGDTAETQALTILEIMLFHPTDRDPDVEVRREVARTIANWTAALTRRRSVRSPDTDGEERQFVEHALRTIDATVPILVAALDDPDAEIREAAVQGIASRTGKWFRRDLSVRTADADWPAERDSYRRWWSSTSASAVKRSAAAALQEIYAPVDSKGAKARIAGYALPILDDPTEATWRAGYDLFRALSFVTFGAESGPVLEAERRHIAEEARAWVEEKSRRR